LRARRSEPFAFLGENTVERAHSFPVTVLLQTLLWPAGEAWRCVAAGTARVALGWYGSANDGVYRLQGGSGCQASAPRVLWAAGL
jgi:hypothetical protein